MQRNIPCIFNVDPGNLKPGGCAGPGVVKQNTDILVLRDSSETDGSWLPQKHTENLSNEGFKFARADQGIEITVTDCCCLHGDSCLSNSDSEVSRLQGTKSWERSLGYL